ncbi:MAG: M16 family metallopeptidase [Thalassotalea sp.]
MKKTLTQLSLVIPITLLSYGCNTAPNITTDNFSENSSVQTLAKFTGQVPVDPNVIKGELANGIKYLIRKNSKPEKRAEIRLVINAGSVLEDESQLGFAHFAEHMAFNGTEDFKKQEIIEYVQSIGMKFGAHLNAHTSFDETVYKLQIPTDDKKTLEKGIHILENWAHKISFEPEEIDKERGVVIEEMRTRQGANTRVMYKQLPVLFKDSQYAKRLPIGTQEILASGKHEDLIRFYKDWYRPELMSLIAVGDFEPAEVKALFEQYFANIKAAKANPPARTNFTIANNVKPYISIETDPELVRTIVNIQVKQPLFEPHNYQESREALKHQLFIGMLNSRYNDYILKPDATVIGGGGHFSRSFGDKSMFSIGAAVKPGQAKDALAFLLTEVNRTIQHGFSESEFTRQKAAITNRFEKMAKEANNLESRSLAAEYVRHFMKNENIPGVIHENEITQHFIPTITLAEVNAIGQQWLTKENRLIAIYGPDSEKENLPTSEEVISIWHDIDQQKLSAYQDVKIAEQLMSPPTQIGAVVEKTYDDALDFHTWTLSNGVKVLLKQTDFKEDAIEFSARSKGGFSLANDDTLKQILFAPYITQMMGVSELSASDFNKYMQGKSFKLSAKINDRHQSLTGNSSVKDLEDFMQLLHLRFQKPRHDQAAFDTFIARATPYYENSLNSPQGVFNEAIRVKQHANNPRSVKMDAAAIKGHNLASSLAFFHQRFANAKNFNFIFVGNIELDKMETLLATYVATLPTVAAKETWKKRPDLRNKGKLSLTVEKGLEPKANVVIKLFGDSQWSHQEVRKFKTLKNVLNTILRERIREEKSGVYGVRVGGNFSKDDNQYNLSISFSCDPLRAEELTLEIQKIFEELKTDIVDAKYVNNYIEQELKSREIKMKQNGFWRDHLTWLAEPDNQTLSFTASDELLKSMSAEQVQMSAKHYLNLADSLVATLLPEVEALADAEHNNEANIIE